MMKSLTVRSVLAFVILDVLFSPLVSAAFLQLLAVQASSSALLVVAALVLLKMLAWSAYLGALLAPYERFARAPASRKVALVSQADRSIAAAPGRFAVAYALSWAGAYSGVFAVFGLMGSEAVPLSPRAGSAVAVLCVAMLFGGFAFAFPLLGALVTDAGGRCSEFARARGVELDRPLSSLQFRIAIVAVAIGVGPTLWMAALGYMKQVEASHEHRATRARLVASDFAGAARRALRLEPSERAALLRQTAAAASSESVLVFVIDGGGNVVAAPAGSDSVMEDVGLRRWLKNNVAAPSGLRSSIAEDRALAFRRIDDTDQVAVASISEPARASTSYISSAGIFVMLVALWAPICALILGRAVSGPIMRLTSAARQIVEDGDLSQMGTLPVARNDEVGMLTDKFNDLLDLMRRLGTAADAIARGDLRVEVEGKGELLDAFRGMLESLRKMVTQIRETSVDLASAAAEIFAASQEQEAAATSQSSAMVEISRTMDSLSDSAAHVSDAVQGVLANAERALTNTDDMVRRIGELSAHAGRIGEILEVIREVADRSDLLALNGSLEASRAGEGGHGFAMVAGEMRRLAERVTASVQDVKKLVSDIRESGSTTVMATQESKKLAEGTTEAARQITFVTQQQRSGTEQVSQSVKGIAEVVALAVSATSQTRTSAESLKVQADRLSDLVRRFEITPSEAA